VIILGVRNLEVINHGSTQIRKAKEGEDQPQAARILQQDWIIQGEIIIFPYQSP